jgi:alpha-beta hydrolase superfamily lysophospholipase
MHGTADQIASWEASRTFAEKAGDLVDLILWQGYYHELHHDLGSDQVIETMIYWMDEQLK